VHLVHTDIAPADYLRAKSRGYSANGFVSFVNMFFADTIFYSHVRTLERDRLLPAPRTGSASPLMHELRFLFDKFMADVA
jgi:hypothetical protein